MGNKISTRFVVAIFSTLLEEILLVMAVLWGLPYLGVHIPLAGLIALMVALLVYAVTTYSIVSRSLKRKPVIGLPNMIGSKAKVVSPLDPDGLVKIRDEIWQAKSAGMKIDNGEMVTVIEQDGLVLIVDRGGVNDVKAAE